MSNITPISFCEETIALVKQIEKTFLILAERLYRIQSENLWDNGQWTSYAEFLEMGAKMSEGTASKLVKIYRRYVLEYGLDSDRLASIPWTKLYAFLPAVTNKQQAEEVIAEASQMTRQHIDEEIRAGKYGECEHEWVEVVKCIKCHKTQKTYEE